MIIKKLARRIADGLTGYVVALRISAAAAMPDSFRVDELQSPAPIIRTDPSDRMAGDFDPRELVAGSSGLLHVLVVEHRDSHINNGSKSAPFNLN